MTATLSDILLNPLLLYHTAPYLSLRSICNLIRTCRAFRSALLDNSRLYRYVDLEDTILQMLKRVPESEEIHEVIDVPEGRWDVRGDGKYIDKPKCIARQVPSGDAAAKRLKRFQVFDKYSIFDLNAMPDYGIQDLGKYTGITSKQIQSINSGKDALKIVLSTPAIAILMNRLLSEVPANNSKRGCRIDNIFEVHETLLGICARLTRVVLNVLVNGQQLMTYVRILVLDGIMLDKTIVLQEVILLVRRRAIPLSLLSVRETGLLRYMSVLPYIRRQIELSAMEDTQSSSRPGPLVLGIYLLGRKDSPRPQMRRLGSGTEASVRRDGIRKKGERNSSNGDSSNNSKGQDDSVMPAIGDQLGYQWQTRPQVSIGDEDSQDKNKSSKGRSSATEPAHDWYRQTGEMIPQRDDLTYWALGLFRWNSLMKANERNSTPGLRLVFDGVICPGPRHDEKWVDFMQAEQAESRDKVSHLTPRIATVALGSDGCRKCGSCPESAASWPKSPIWKLPLLGPVPRFESSVRKAQCPWMISERGNSNAGEGSDEGLRLIVRCQECLGEQYDARSKKWICEYCFHGVRYDGVLEG